MDCFITHQHKTDIISTSETTGEIAEGAACAASVNHAATAADMSIHGILSCPACYCKPSLICNIIFYNTRSRKSLLHLSISQGVLGLKKVEDCPTQLDLIPPEVIIPSLL